MDVKQLLGNRIQEIRLKKGFTQDQLSEKVGINSKYLSSIERGKENPTLNTLLSLAQALNVNLNDLTSMLEIEDPTQRKNLIYQLLDRASDDQLKTIYKILCVIVQ